MDEALQLPVTVTPHTASAVTALRSRLGMAFMTLRCLWTTQRWRGVAGKRAANAASNPSCPSVTIKSTCVAPRRRRSCNTQLLPKRKGHPFRSAPKPCMRLITSHSSSRMWSVVIDTLRHAFRMPLVVAVSVKCHFVAHFFTATLTFRGDVIHLNLIFVSKEQFTPSAFSLLFL